MRIDAKRFLKWVGRATDPANVDKLNADAAAARAIAHTIRNLIEANDTRALVLKLLQRLIAIESAGEQKTMREMLRALIAELKEGGDV